MKKKKQKEAEENEEDEELELEDHENEEDKEENNGIISNTSRKRKNSPKLLLRRFNKNLIM